MIFIYKISNTSCIWHFTANHFTFCHLEEIKISLNEVLFCLPKPCFESAPSFSISGHLSIGLPNFFESCQWAHFCPVIQPSALVCRGMETREPCLLEQVVN